MRRPLFEGRSKPAKCLIEHGPDERAHQHRAKFVVDEEIDCRSRSSRVVGERPVIDEPLEWPVEIADVDPPFSGLRDDPCRETLRNRLVADVHPRCEFFTLADRPPRQHGKAGTEWQKLGIVFDVRDQRKHLAG